VLYLNQDTANNFSCLKLNASIALFCGWLIDLYLNVHEMYDIFSLPCFQTFFELTHLTYLYIFKKAIFSTGIFARMCWKINEVLLCTYYFFCMQEIKLGKITQILVQLKMISEDEESLN
jgi:hypothetical protein